MAIEPITYVSWSELSGIRPSESEVRQGLSVLGRNQTVELLARLGSLLYIDVTDRKTEGTRKLQRFLVANLIDDELLQALKSRYGHDKIERRVCFHLQQVLTALKWVILDADPNLDTDFGNDLTARYSLGRCLIQTNDLLFGDKVAKLFAASKQTINTCLALQLSGGPTFEVNNPPPLICSVVRSDWLFGDLAKTVQKKLDIPLVFEQVAGLPLDTYVDMTIGILSHYLSRDRNELLEDPGQVVLNPRTLFGSLTGKLSESFWTKESASIDQLRKDLERPSKLQPYHDFVAFRMKPFIRLRDDAVICMNPGFIQEKLESGLFWAIVNELDEDRRKLMFETWGGLFESYADELLRAVVPGNKDTYLPFPQFTKKGQSHESFDAVIHSNQKCAVIECKAGFLKGPAKYAEDQDAFLEDLDKKFGGHSGGGIEQLVRKIRQVFARKVDERRPVVGIDPTQVRLVTPVLLVQEPFVSSMFTAPWLSRRFRDLMRKNTDGLLRNVNWTGLVVIHIEELERLCAHIAAGHISFTEALSYRTAKGDPGFGNRVFTFWDTVKEVLERKSSPPLKQTEFDNRFRKLLDRVCMRFFGQKFGQNVEVAHG